jgi:tRNA A37 methylthiotransferase MiaB
MNACIAPARRGKDSSKDCLVYETYLEAVTSLRNAGVVKPIVFLSSNTKEYLTENNILRTGIAAEFSNINLKYVPNMSAAKFTLGL